MALETYDVVLRRVAAETVNPLLLGALQDLKLGDSSLLNEFVRAQIQDKLFIVCEPLEVVFVLSNVRLHLLDVSVQALELLFFFLAFVQQLLFFLLLVSLHYVVIINEAH
jgi:hypothetical protein